MRWRSIDGGGVFEHAPSMSERKRNTQPNSRARDRPFWPRSGIQLLNPPACENRRPIGRQFASTVRDDWHRGAAILAADRRLDGELEGVRGRVIRPGRRDDIGCARGRSASGAIIGLYRACLPLPTIARVVLARSLIYEQMLGARLWANPTDGDPRAKSTSPKARRIAAEAFGLIGPEHIGAPLTGRTMLAGTAMQDLHKTMLR